MSQELNELTKAIPGVVYQFRVAPDGSWQFCYLSEGIRQLYETSPEAAYADHTIISQCIVEEDRASHRASVEQASKNLTPWLHEHRICTASGKLKWVRAQALPCPQHDGSVLWNGILIDITEHKNNEACLLRLKKIYTAVLKANQLISRTRDLSELLQGICKIAVELGGMKMAWIGVPDALNERILPVASYGTGTTYLDNIFISTHAEVPEGCGPTGIAFRENRTILNQDFQGNLITEPWHQRAKPYGWGSSATVSVQRDGKPYAVLSVYAPETNAFDDEVVSLLEELAADISYAVDVMDLEHEQQEVAKQLEHSEKIFRTLFQTVHQGIVFQDMKGHIIAANPAAESILGLSVDQMQGRTSMDRRWAAIHPDGSPFSAETHPAMLAIKTGKPLQNVVMGIKNPQLHHTVWLNVNATPIFKENSTELDYAYTTFDDITKQLQWESALRESEERFRSLANAAPVLIWITDSDKNGIWFNDTWLQYTGRTTEQERGNGWTESVHPSDLPRCLELYVSHFDKRQSFNMEYRLRSKDGKYHWFIAVGKPRRDEQGQFCGYIGMLTDIDDKKSLEETVRFHKFSLDHAGEKVFWIDKNGQILEANETACSRLGYSQEEIKQLSVADLDPAIPFEKWPAHWQELKQKKSLRFESMHKTRDGQTYPTEIVANYFECDGEEYICALVRDISERKAFEQALREKTDYLNTILNSEPECVKVVDQQGQLIEMNQAGLKLLEVDSVEEVQKYGLLNFVLPEFRLLFQKLHREVFQGKTATLEFVLQSKHGKQHWVDTHAAPLYDENGQVKALVAVTRDITERISLLQELETQAHKDFLTGLSNRRHFFTLAEQELSRTQRYNNPLSILMMDIDFFKSINDAHGHNAGDLVLQKLASICLATLREIDVIGRMGGEEFAVLLPETTGTRAMEVAERMRQALENATVILEHNNLALKFTVSIGVTTMTSPEVTIDSMLQDADAALYQAKNSGRNKVVNYPF